MLPDAAALLVLRHGQSTWNADGRWQGRQDPPLSPLGVRQARAAAATLGTFDAVVSSTLERAHTTASLIAGELGIGPVVADEALVERAAGPWEGLTKPEIDERWPGARAEGRHPDGWEDDDALAERAVAALARVAGSVGVGGTALVVSHGGLIRCLESLLGAHRERRIGNLAGRWFHVGPGVLRAGDEVTLLDDDLATVPGQI